MCGICGIYNIGRSVRTVERHEIEKMLDSISHRGPNGRRSEILDEIGLGFNRLAFLDIKGGMQPLSNEDGSVIMVCNGEIFNFRDIRDELVGKGHMFRTHTDVEVVPHLYEEYGEDFVTHLNGQFAIALFDKRIKKLFLYRDHMGICPLFYTMCEGRVVFGSEIKAILTLPEVPRKINLKAIDQLMNYPGVVSPNTFFDGIYSLKAGHYISISKESGMKEHEYWDACYVSDDEDKGEEYYIETLRELIKDAVGRRLFADVPVGFYVSGGLDSSVVAGTVGRYFGDEYYSFSAEIGEDDLNEKRYQQLICDSVVSRHFNVKVGNREIERSFENVIYHAESAVKETYDAAAYMLSGLVHSSAARGVLTGQGADELFYGYIGYSLDLFRTMQKDSINPDEAEINERLWGKSDFKYERDHDALSEYSSLIYSKDVRGDRSKFSAIMESPIDLSKVRGLSDGKRRSYIDLKMRLSDHLLIEHGDHMFFSHSIEGRHPFLDREIVDFAMRVPDRYKLKGTNEKYLLKKAAEGIVPMEIIKRKKFPFQAPGMSTLVKKHPDLPYLDEDIIRKQGIFDVNFVRRLKEKYREDDFRLMGAYEVDYLQIVMTVTMLCEMYSLSL